MTIQDDQKNEKERDKIKREPKMRENKWSIYN